MTEIDIESIKPNTIYCYYQRLDDLKWLAFIKYIEDDEDDDDTYTFGDVCNCYSIKDHNVEIDPPDYNFDVVAPLDNDSSSCILFFEMTEDEIRDHVIMEFI